MDFDQGYEGMYVCMCVFVFVAQAVAEKKPPCVFAEPPATSMLPYPCSLVIVLSSFFSISSSSPRNAHESNFFFSNATTWATRSKRINPKLSLGGAECQSGIGILGLAIAARLRTFPTDQNRLIRAKKKKKNCHRGRWYRETVEKQKGESQHFGGGGWMDG